MINTEWSVPKLFLKHVTSNDNGLMTQWFLLEMSHEMEILHHLKAIRSGENILILEDTTKVLERKIKIKDFQSLSARTEVFYQLKIYTNSEYLADEKSDFRVSMLKKDNDTKKKT